MIAQEPTGEVFYLSSDHGGSISGGFCQSCKKHHVVIAELPQTTCPICQGGLLPAIKDTTIVFT